MRQSLLSLFQFLDGEKLLPEGFLDQVSAFLENQSNWIYSGKPVSR